MKSPLRTALTLGIWCLMVFSVMESNAFSLLGPFQPWMQQTNDLRQTGDIGGPMLLGSGYRWNVPVVTYGFDPSFIQYFGTNGVVAVESAIQIINNLPPASQIALTNYPYLSMRFNPDAQGEYLLDLKSTTLSLLLEQLGLLQPTRYIYVLKQWDPVFVSPQSWDIDWPDWVFPDYISERNFDPQTLNASYYVNNDLYVGYIQVEGNQNVMVMLPSFPGEVSPTAVADRPLQLGELFLGLTYDDVGGLRYLYSTNTIQFETLPPGVRSVGRHEVVDAALRPGINKITFMPQPVDANSGVFLPVRNRFVDNYIMKGVTLHQSVERVIKQPDFLFCAGNVNYGGSSIETISPSNVPLVYRTGATNWVNNAALNGNPGGDGPGIIQPQVKIIFSKLGNVLFGYQGQFYGESGTVFWGSFDATTNFPAIYPVPQNGTASFDVRLLLTPSRTKFIQNQFDWPLTNAIGSVSLFQISTNLIDWSTLFSATNDGTIWTFQNYYPSSSQQFYRVIPL